MFQRNGYYTSITTDKNNNLIVTLNPENREAALEELPQGEDKGFWVNTSEGFRRLIGDHLENGLDWIQPEEVGALTDSIILSDSAEYNDEGELTNCEYVWWFPEYMLIDPLDVLVEYGKVAFTYQKD